MEIIETRKTDYYTMIRFSRKTSDYHKTIAEIDHWCQRTQCGKRVNFNSFAFKKEEEIMMFKLRWMTQIVDNTKEFIG